MNASSVLSIVLASTRMGAVYAVSRHWGAQSTLKCYHGYSCGVADHDLGTECR